MSILRPHGDRDNRNHGQIQEVLSERHFFSFALQVFRQMRDIFPPADAMMEPSDRYSRQKQAAHLRLPNPTTYPLLMPGPVAGDIAVAGLSSSTLIADLNPRMP